MSSAHPIDPQLERMVLQLAGLVDARTDVQGRLRRNPLLQAMCWPVQQLESLEAAKTQLEGEIRDLAGQIGRASVQLGDVVEPRLGGSLMNVRSVTDTHVLCTWMDHTGQRHSDVFVHAALRVVFTGVPSTDERWN